MSTVVVLVSLYGLGVVHSLIYQVFMRSHVSWRARPRYAISRATRLFGLALIPVYIAVLGDFPIAFYVFHQPPPAPAVYALAMALGVSSLVLLATSLRALGDNFSACTDGRLPLKIVDHGPYRFLSHPIYVSNVLLLVSCTVMLFSWVLVAATLVTASFYLRSAMDEARALRKLGPAS